MQAPLGRDKVQTLGVAGNPRMGLRQRRQKKHRQQRNEARTKRGVWSELLHALLRTLPSGKVEAHFHFSAKINYSNESYRKNNPQRNSKKLLEMEIRL
jgi:hypothetical protein